MQLPILACGTGALSRSVRALGLVAAIAAFALLSVDAIRRYMGIAAYYRFERSWLSHQEDNENSRSADPAFGKHVAWLKRSLHFDSALAYAHYELGREYLENPRKPAAPGQIVVLQHLRRAIDLECTRPEYHLTLGLLYARMADESSEQAGPSRASSLFQQAVQELSLACDLDLGHPRYPLSLGDLFASRHMRASAITMYRLAFARNNRPCEHWRRVEERKKEIMGRVFALRSSFLDLESVVGDTLPCRMQIAHFLTETGRAAYATSMLVRAGELTEDSDLGTRPYIARRLINTKAPRAAIGLLTRWLGMADRESKQPRLDVIERAQLGDLQANLPLYMALARAYDVAKQPKLAIAVSARICQRIDAVANPEPAYALARRYFAKRRSADAIALLTEWQRKRDARLGPRSRYKPNECSVLAFLGYLYSTSRQPEQAALVYRALIDRGEDTKWRDQWQRQLSDCYLRLNRVPDALAHYKSAVQSRPDSAAAHYALAGAYERAGDMRRAVREYRDAANLEPGNAGYARAAKKARLRLRTGH